MERCWHIKEEEPLISLGQHQERWKGEEALSDACLFKKRNNLDRYECEQKVIYMRMKKYFGELRLILQCIVGVISLGWGERKVRKKVSGEEQGGRNENWKRPTENLLFVWATRICFRLLFPSSPCQGRMNWHHITSACNIGHLGQEEKSFWRPIGHYDLLNDAVVGSCCFVHYIFLFSVQENENDFVVASVGAHPHLLLCSPPIFKLIRSVKLFS